jgi:branched-subunit amino acid ABC-type transport system permease component
VEQLPGYLINGIITGSQYALFAAGLAIIFGVVRVFNFAHGVLFVAGGYAMYVLVSNEITTSPYIAVPIASSAVPSWSSAC